MRQVGIAVLWVALLLLGTLGLPTSGSQAPPLYEVVDPTGDAHVFNQGLGPVPASAATDPGDIVAFRIVEDAPDLLTFEVQVVDLYDATTGAANLFMPTFTVEFSLEGTDAFYRIVGRPPSAIIGEDPGDTVQSVPASICIVVPGDSCFDQAAYGRVWWGLETVKLHFPKAALLGLRPTASSSDEPLPDVLPSRLDPGARLLGLRAWTNSLFVWDEALDAQQSYALATPTANAELRLVPGWPSDGFDRAADAIFSSGLSAQRSVAVDLDGVTVLPLRLVNTGDSLRVVHISTELRHGAASQWDVQVAPTIQLPAHDTRTVNLILGAEDTLAHRDAVELHIRAEALGHEETMGYLRLELQAAHAPTPDRPVFYLHAAPYRQPVVPGMEPFEARAWWINALEDDPLDAYRNGVNTQGFGANVFGEAVLFTATFTIDTALPDDLVMDWGMPGTASLAFEARAGINVEASVTITANNVLVASGDVTGNIGTATGWLDIPLRLTPNAERHTVPRGGLAVTVEVRSSEPTQLANQWQGITLIPAESSITLPIVEDPLGEPVDVKAGPSRVGLYTDDPTRAFVNPNRTSIFELVLANEGVDTDDVAFNITVDDENWTVDVQPADAYRLGPGESVEVGLLVTPPANASEGQEVSMEVRAESQRADGTTAFLALKAVVTHNLVAGEDNDTFEADNETLSKALDDEGAESPGLGVAGLLGPALAAIGIHRRRTVRQE